MTDEKRPARPLDFARAAKNAKLVRRLLRDPAVREESFVVLCPGCDRVVKRVRKVGTKAELEAWRAAHARGDVRKRTHTGCCRAIIGYTHEADALAPGLDLGTTNLSVPVVDEVEVFADGSAVVRGAWLAGARVLVGGREVPAASATQDALLLSAGSVRGPAPLVLENEHGRRDVDHGAFVAPPDARDEAVVYGPASAGSPRLRARSGGREIPWTEHAATLQTHKENA